MIIESRQKTIDTLLSLYYNQNLTDYLKGANDEDLEDFEYCLAGPNTIEEHFIPVLDAIRTEREYRQNNQYIRDNQNLEHDQIVKKVSQDEVSLTIDYLTNLGIDFENMVNNNPIILSIDMISRLYTYLKKEYNWNDDEVRQLLFEYPKRSTYTVNLLNSARKRLEEQKTSLLEEDFKHFLIESANRINSQKTNKTTNNNK